VQHVIVDGGSTDGSLAVIENLARRDVIWVSEPDHGIADAFNKGTRLATGDYVCYLNAGDVFSDPGVLERVAAQIEGDHGADSAIYYGDFFSRRGELKFFHRASARPADFAWRNPINHQSAFIPLAVARDTGYDPRLRLGMDYDFWLRVSKVCPFRKLEFPIAVFASDGRSSDPQWAVHNLVTRRALWHINHGTRIHLHELTGMWLRGAWLSLKAGMRWVLGARALRWIRRGKARWSIKSAAAAPAGKDERPLVAMDAGMTEKP
jgi:glycosyltransferase involved in cell wall biosynthesis